MKWDGQKLAGLGLKCRFTASKQVSNVIDWTSGNVSVSARNIHERNKRLLFMDSVFGSFGPRYSRL